jgi:hypothetical protein
LHTQKYEIKEKENNMTPNFIHHLARSLTIAIILGMTTPAISQTVEQCKAARERLGKDPCRSLSNLLALHTDLESIQKEAKTPELAEAAKKCKDDWVLFARDSVCSELMAQGMLAEERTVDPYPPGCTSDYNACRSRLEKCVDKNNCHELTLYTKNCHDTATPAEIKCEEELKKGRGIDEACWLGAGLLYQSNMCLR